VQDRAIQASKELKQLLRQDTKNRKYRFEFGEKEAKLMETIDRLGFITLPDFAKLAGISERQASRTLVLLVLGGLLELEPTIYGDHYKRKAPNAKASDVPA
jgi:Fic family protein